MKFTKKVAGGNLFICSKCNKGSIESRSKTSEDK